MKVSVDWHGLDVEIGVEEIRPYFNDMIETMDLEKGETPSAKDLGEAIESMLSECLSDFDIYPAEVSIYLTLGDDEVQTLQRWVRT